MNTSYSEATRPTDRRAAEHATGLHAMFVVSVLLHLLGLTTLSLVTGRFWSMPLPPQVLPAELLVEPPAAVATAPPLPEPPPLSELEPSVALPPTPAPFPEPVVPPRLLPAPVPKRSEKLVSEPVVPPRVESRPAPKRLEKSLAEPVPARVKPSPALAAQAPRQDLAPSRLAASAGAAAQAAPSPASPLPTPLGSPAAAAGQGMGLPAAAGEATPRLPAEGGEAGAGKLFDRGDTGVIPGAGAGGGSGASGRAGLGASGSGVSGSQQGGGITSGTGGGGGAGGGSGLARPLGGYQVKPRYPEAARRLGVKGTTLLKIHVSEKGLVTDVVVAHSAGHQELDLAALEAVKQWRFEPAKRGDQAVAVWVTLPVRFVLK